MFYSKKLNLLFIASPKSGSTSIENYLAEIDENGENFSITLKNKKITGRDMYPPDQLHVGFTKPIGYGWVKF